MFPRGVIGYVANTLTALGLSLAVFLAAETAGAQETLIAQDKVSPDILAHQRDKLRPPGIMPEAHRKRLRRLGLDPDSPDAEHCSLYVRQRLTDPEIAELATQGILVNSWAWVPSVPGQHPYGFHLALVCYDALDTVRADERIVRLASTEYVCSPCNDLGRNMIHVNDVHDGNGVPARDGTGRDIAIADSGLDVGYVGAHPDFPAPVEAYDMTDGTDPTNWGTDVRNTVTDHGTHVTGTALGRGTQSGGVYKGSAPGASLYFYKIGNDVAGSGSASHEDMIEAILRAQHAGPGGDVRCDVFSMSYGGWSTPHLDGSSDVCQAIDSAVANGMICFVSAGNERDEDQHYSADVAPGVTTGTFGFSVPGDYDEDEYIRVIWRDDDPTSDNISLACTNLGAGESLTVSTGHGTSPRNTESKCYKLEPDAPPAGKTYLLTLTNNAAAGQTPKVHLYCTTSDGEGTFDNPDPHYTVEHPALADNAIAVGAWTQRRAWVNYQNIGFTWNDLFVDTLAPFSAYGPRVDGRMKPDIVAPGAATISCRDPGTFNDAQGTQIFPDDSRIIDNDWEDGEAADGVGPAQYYVSRGTSMSAPLVAGVAALLLEEHPWWNPNEVEAALKSTADDRGLSSDEVGAGLIDALAAIQVTTARVYVDCDATGANDGSDWANACTDLQDGLQRAVDGFGTEIWVAEGTYRPDRGTNDRNATFRLIEEVKLYGGFDGTENDLNDRDPSAHVTILSGEIGTPDDAGDNCYHVVTAGGTTWKTALDGFTIAGGYANGDADADADKGGGLYNKEGSPQIKNCTFSENYAVRGGGAYNDNGFSLLQDCTFKLNTAARGAGCFNQNSFITVNNCTFRQNTASVAGGGMCNDASGPLLSDCLFVDNAATSDVSPCTGGGMDNTATSNPSMTDCTFSGNRAFGASYGRGGAVRNGADCDSTMINCTFNANRCYDHGGALRNEDSDPVLINCRIIGNHTNTHGGGMCSCLASHPTLTNCTVCGNKAASGGGIGHTNATSTVTNCIFWDNTDSSGTGEAAQIEGGPPDINYSCVQGWTGALGGTGNFEENPWFAVPTPTWTANATFDQNTCKTTFENTAANWTPGALVGKFLNPNTDQFLQGIITANTATTVTVWGDLSAQGPSGAAYKVNDYRLIGGAECIDGGNNDADTNASLEDLQPLPQTDFEGNPRFANDAGMVDGGAGLPPIVDVGACEFQGQTCFADFSGNGEVGLADLAELLSNYGTPSGATYKDGDLNRDGAVSLPDLAALLSVYGTICE